MAKLTDKQARFCAEYLIDLNATAAAKRAGYSEKTARSQGQRLLTNVDIQVEIQKAADKRSERVGITADAVLEELRKLGFSNMLDYVRTTKAGDVVTALGQMTRDQAAAVQEITVETYLDGRGEDAEVVKRTKFKLADKKSSLELLGKHLKLFTEKHEHSGLDGSPLTIRVLYDDDQPS